MDRSSEEAAVVCAFLRRVADDRTRARVLTLAEYQAMYPRFEAAIAREFGLLEPEPDSFTGTESPSGVMEKLDAACDPRVELSAASSSAPGGASAEGPTIGRYEDVGEIARGGMGSVHVVRDRDLRRRLAMKLLLDGGVVSGSGSGDPRLLTRFLEEAQITSQLEHPGVVPVHELGVDDSGRVFFTMALVHGGTFEAVIGDVQAGGEEWPLARALGVLQRVCEAVAFAHNKGVVHRDLKPANIMVGQFGEVYVMDWGLARVVGAVDRKDIRLEVGGGSVSTVRTAVEREGSDAPLRTMDGDVVGTACYMPPEQARGDVERVGPPADVYAIGAVLYHLLAGRMPFTGAGERLSSRAVLDRVLRGPPQSIQELAPDAPAELAAICEKAMARDACDRYPDVRELGAELRAFLEVRVVRAYETGAVAELRKWVRRNKSQAIAVAAAVVVLVAGLVFSIVQAERADAAARRAETNFELASDAVGELVRIGGDALANVPQVDEMRREMLQRALAFHLRFVEVRGGEFEVRERAADAWFRVADIRRQLGDVDGARDASVAALDIFRRLVGERPERIDLLATQAWVENTLGDLHLSRGEWNAALARFRSASETFERVTEREPEAATHRVRFAHTLHNMGATYNWQERYKDGLAHMKREIRLRREIALAHPEEVEYQHHLATAESGIAFPLRQLGRHEESLGHLEESVRLYGRVLAEAPDVREYRHHAGIARNQLGGLHLSRRRNEAARDVLAEAVDIRRDLARDHPHVPEYQSALGMVAGNLARALVRLRDYDGARRSAEEAINVQAAALERIPDEPIFRRSMRNHYAVLLRALSVGLDHRELARRSNELLSIELGEPAWALHTAGYHLARSASIARSQDKSLAPAERDGLINDYGRRAVAALRGALDAGWADWNLRSTVFVVVHKRADFLALEADVGDGER